MKAFEVVGYNTSKYCATTKWKSLGIRGESSVVLKDINCTAT